MRWPCGPAGLGAAAHSELLAQLQVVQDEPVAVPRKLSAAPIGVFFKCKTLFEALVEHFIPRLQVVDKEETVGFPRCLLIQPVQLLLWQQRPARAGCAASSSAGTACSPARLR